MPPIRLVVQCKTLTPTICSGSVQERFELRAPAIKGQLRFWYRAFQPLDGAELFKHEATLFGSTNNKSRISLAIDLPKVSLLEAGSVWPKEFPDGLKYLLFPIIKTKNESKNPKRKQYVTRFTRELPKPGLAFTLELKIQDDKEQKEHLLDLLSTLWLLENFGGIGARTRQGLGSFKIQKIELYEAKRGAGISDVDNTCPLFETKGVASPEEYLKGGLDWIQARWGRRSGDPTYTSLSKDSSLMVLRQNSSKTPLELLGVLGEKLRKYRNTHPYNEAKMMHDALRGGSVPPGHTEFLKPGIGLPITYRFKKNFGKVKVGDFGGAGGNLPLFYRVMGERGSPKDKNHKLFDRRSSPLFFSIHQWKDNSPYITALLMPAPFLPDDTHLVFQGYEEVYTDKKRRELRREGFDFTTPIPGDDFARAVMSYLEEAFKPAIGSR